MSVSSQTPEEQFADATAKSRKRKRASVQTLAVGDHISRTADSALYEVVGIESTTGRNRWAVRPVSHFGGVESLSAKRLAAEFGVTARPPATDARELADVENLDKRIRELADADPLAASWRNLFADHAEARAAALEDE